jgi:hypothetical protein
MTDTAPPLQRRGEDRIPVNTRQRPFLATKAESSLCFPYLLRDVSTQGVGIARPDALRQGVDLQVGESLNFHLPFRLSRFFFDQGSIRWRKRDESLPGELCGALLEKRVPLYYPLYVAFDTGQIVFKADAPGASSEIGILRAILHDAQILKKGVRVYFNHLVPYFRRISDYEPARFPRLRAGFLTEILEKLDDNIVRLEHFSDAAAEPGYTLQRMAADFDLEAFRRCIEPELVPEEFVDRFDSRAVIPYLRSIKRLEHRLYANHNAVVLLSLQAGASSSALLK